MLYLVYRLLVVGKRMLNNLPNIARMKKIIVIALFILTIIFPFRSNKGSVKLSRKKEVEQQQRIEATNKLTRKNVYEYLYYLTKDSVKTDLYFRILINESQLKSTLALQHNNICGMRKWETTRKYFVGLTKSKYCIYTHWRYSVKDLVQYMEHYGNRAWYFRFKRQLRRIDTSLNEPESVYKVTNSW